MSGPEGKSLYRLHRILIVVAVVQGLVLTVWGVHGYFHEGTTSHLVVAALSAIGAAGLYAYLGWFRRKRAQPPR